MKRKNDPLYQTMQEGTAAYKIDVPAGLYEVELRRAELSMPKRANGYLQSS